MFDTLELQAYLLLTAYMALVDKFVQIAAKEDLAECIRLLAMNVAHYQLRYGELPLEEQLGITSKLNDYHAELLTKGMETMTGVPGSSIRDLDEKISH